MRNDIKRRIALITAVFALIGVASACSSTSAGTSAAVGSSHSTVVVAYNNEVSTLDPVGADFAESNLIQQALYDRLLGYNAQDEIVNSLATSATLSSNATAVNITLRSGIKFHDGNALTAQDVAYTLNRDAKIGTGVAQFLTGYSSTTVLNDNQLVIHLSTPNSLFLGGLSKIYIVDAKLVQQHAGTDNGQGWLANHDAGSGPFELASGARPQSGTITVTRFGGYWAFSAGRPKTIVYQLFTNSASERSAISSGSLDLAPDLTPSDANTLQGSSGITVIKPLVSAQLYVYFNMVSGPTANIDVRRAIQLAYDYNGAMTKIRDGAAVLANGPLPTNMPCRPTLPSSSQNISEAKAMLAKSGLHNLTLTLNYQTYDPLQVQEATLLQSDLRQIGISLNLVTITFPDYLARLSKTSQIPQMMLAEDFAQYPNPGMFLVNYYMSTRVGSNRTGYDSPAVDTLLNKALASPTTAQQCTYYSQAQQIIDQDAVAVNMYTVATPYAFRSWLKGVHVTSTGFGPWIPDLRVS